MSEYTGNRIVSKAATIQRTAGVTFNELFTSRVRNMCENAQYVCGESIWFPSATVK